MNEKMKRVIKECIPFAIEIIVVLLLFRYVFFFIIVPTGSMIPTIYESSFILVTRVHSPEKSLERGDIVAFHSDELDVRLVKRLIGMPGDRVVIDDLGAVTINGTALDESYVKFPSYMGGEFQVPEQSYFFLGDNRGGSFDARSWQNPYIPAHDIEGKAVFTLWPLQTFGLLK